MPDASELLVYAQVGPTIEATSWVGSPVAGATTKFQIKVTRDHDPIDNAVVTLQVKDYNGTIVYPPSGIGTSTVSRDIRFAGTYMIVPDRTNIFRLSGTQYEVIWNISVPATTLYPASVLPFVQRFVAQDP